MPGTPLPERIRPRTLDEFCGQHHLLDKNGVLQGWIQQRNLPSLIMWGPPGCGKTTLARILAEQCELHFQSFSAVLGGVGELRKLIAEAENLQGLGTHSVIFIDEIHRFNKAQQDALLPHVEAGTITLIGATTENPSFSCNRALLSRCRVVQLEGLDETDLSVVIATALGHPDGVPDAIISDEARDALVRLAAGDARRCLLVLEEAWTLSQPETISLRAIKRVLSAQGAGHDRAGEQHYDVASAFIKSMRASDVQAALFYLARQLENGEDPRFVARRIVIFASEDVGLADSHALQVASAAFQAVERIGMPEAIYPLSHACIYCATAPKSNSTKAYFAAARAVKEHPGAQVPLFLRNAPTELMKELGYKEGYRYDHDYPNHFSGQNCLPEELRDARFYEPGNLGFEKDIAKRMEWWDKRRQDPEHE